MVGGPLPHFVNGYFRNCIFSNFKKLIKSVGFDFEKSNFFSFCRNLTVSFMFECLILKISSSSFRPPKIPFAKIYFKYLRNNFFKKQRTITDFILLYNMSGLCVQSTYSIIFYKSFKNLRIYFLWEKVKNGKLHQNFNPLW